MKAQKTKPSQGSSQTGDAQSWDQWHKAGPGQAGTRPRQGTSPRVKHTSINSQTINSHGHSANIKSAYFLQSAWYCCHRFIGSAKEFFLQFGTLSALPEAPGRWILSKMLQNLFITSFRNSITAVEAVAANHCAEFCLLVWKFTLCYFMLAEEALECLLCVCAFPNSL